MEKFCSVCSSNFRAVLCHAGLAVVRSTGLLFVPRTNSHSVHRKTIFEAQHRGMRATDSPEQSRSYPPFNDLIIVSRVLVFNQYVLCSSRSNPATQQDERTRRIEIHFSRASTYTGVILTGRRWSSSREKHRYTDTPIPIHRVLTDFSRRKAHRKRKRVVCSLSINRIAAGT